MLHALHVEPVICIDFIHREIKMLGDPAFTGRGDTPCAWSCGGRNIWVGRHTLCVKFIAEGEHLGVIPGPLGHTHADIDLGSLPFPTTEAKTPMDEAVVRARGGQHRTVTQWMTRHRSAQLFATSIHSTVRFICGWRGVNSVACRVEI